MSDSLSQTAANGRATTSIPYVTPSDADVIAAMTPETVTDVTADPSDGVLDAGSLATFDVTLSGTASVSGTPELELNDGGVARYVSGSGTDTLLFTTEAVIGQEAGDLAVTGVALDGGSVTGAQGQAVDLSGAVTNPPGVLSIATPPVVASVTAMPSAAGAMEVDTGASVTFTLATSGPVQVTPGAAGALPFLTLNDGGIAGYDEAASTATSLVFTTTIMAGQTTPDLAILALNQNGASLTGIATFEPPATFHVSDGAEQVTVADLNGDGNADLVVGTFGKVDVLLGDGHGGFGPPTTYDTPGEGMGVVVADVNGDGHPDIITAGDGFGVLLGDGKGGFGPVTDDGGTKLGTFRVLASDLNGDGRPDIVTAPVDGTINVSFANASGGFSGPADQIQSAGAHGAVAVADVNGDGHPDLIVPTFGAEIATYLGNGHGGFTEAGDFYGVDIRDPYLGSGNDASTAIAVADVNGDGHPDLLVDGRSGGLGVLFGDGTGHFGGYREFATDTHLQDLVVTDINGDGIPDVLAQASSSSNAGGEMLDIFLGDGHGDFQLQSTVALPSPSDLTLADVNNDGRLDLVTTDFADDSVSVQLGAEQLANEALDTTGLASLPGSATGLSVNEAACFLPGTLIRTPGGEVPIEMLRVGDAVLLADGGSAPVRWVARQTIAPHFADPRRTCPVRVRAGALADGVPARDLLLSPDHALFLDGVLVQAGALVNGTSIVREPMTAERLTYFNLELAAHALIWAEGAVAETFVDNIARQTFDNAAEHAALYPDAPWIAEMALPRAKAWRQVPQSLRRHLADRTGSLDAA